jgi:hypothetical protein
MIRSIAILAATMLFPASASAQELEGDYLYKVSTVRATPGSLSQLLDWIVLLEGSEYFADAGENPPFIMRHSQGDQWDLLIITPMKSWAAYYAKSAAKKRDNAAGTHADLLASREAMIAFEEDQFAFGPPLSLFKALYDENRFFHIEMFEAAPGKADQLLEQRRMENEYLTATGQTANLIFQRAAGSDIDVFTIGFYKSLEAFATPANVSDEEKEVAAIAAGFKDRSDLSFYLRALITGHHDTLATKIE